MGRFSLLQNLMQLGHTMQQQLVIKYFSISGEIPESVNKTSTGNGGKQNSPNYPKDYYNNLDHTYHLVAPRGTQIVIRFTHLDVEEQEDCLYDFVEIIDRHTKNSTRFCGTHPSNELNK